MLIKKGWLCTRERGRLKKVLNLKIFWSTIFSILAFVGVTTVIISGIYLASLQAVLWMYKFGVYLTELL